MAASDLKRIVSYLGLAIWLALPFVLMVLPAGQFDHGPALCPSKAFFNIECPGCGLIRATMHALHLQFTQAWEFNKLIVVVLPALILVWIHVAGRLAGKNWLPFLRRFY